MIITGDSFIARFVRTKDTLSGNTVTSNYREIGMMDFTIVYAVKYKVSQIHINNVEEVHI